MKLEHHKTYDVGDEALYERVQKFLLGLTEEYPALDVNVRWHPERLGAEFVWQKVNISMQVRGHELSIHAELPLRFMLFKPLIIKYLEQFLEQV